MSEASPRVESDLDSITLGTPGKGGTLKVYFNSTEEPEYNDARVEEAVRVGQKIREMWTE